MPDKVSPLEFAESVKKKYPEYKDYDNIELTNAIIKKYPEYKDYVNMGGPLPAGPKPAPVQGIPTFQEQLPTMQANRFDEAVSKDKKKSGSYIGALYDSFVSAVDPLMYIGDEAFLGAYQYMSGKKLAPQEKQAIRKAVGTTMQIAGARPMKTQDEGVVESIQGGWDLSDGFGSKDLKALGLMGSRVAGDLAIAAASTAVGVPPGSTYFAQGYGSGLQDYNDMVAKGSLEENGLAKQTYALTVGTINGLLEKLAFDKIFGKGPAFDAVKKRVTADILKQVAKSNTKVTMDVVEKVGEQMLKKELSSLGKRGARAGYAAGVEALTEGVQAGSEDLAKLLTNAVQGQQVFDEEDIKKNFIKNVLNSAAAGFALGAPMGIASTMMSNVDNTIVKEIAKAKDETELNSVISELEESMAKSNASEEEIDAMRQSAIKYNSIKQTIPATVSDEAKSNIISLIDRRNGIDEKMSNWQAELEMVDESMKPDVESEMTTLIDAKELINDEIRENASGGKFTYTEDNGKYFKQFEGEDPVEIKKSTYELKKTIENATKKSEGTVQESSAVSDISQRQGTQEGGTQKAPAQADSRYRNISSEETVGIPTLLGSKVTYKVGNRKITGTLIQEGQTLSVENESGDVVAELGNIDELSSMSPEQMNLTVIESRVEPTENGFAVDGKELFNENENPFDAVSVDKNGKVMNVVLTTTGGKRRKFRGKVAQDLAAQINQKEDQKAQQADQRLQQEFALPTPTAPKKITTQPTIARVTEDNVAELDNVQGTPLQKKVLNDAKKVVTAIGAAVRNITGSPVSVNVHDQKSYTAAVIEAGATEEEAKSRGFYMADDGSIHLNMDNIDSDTMLHEGFHPILDALQRFNPAVINDLFAQLESIPEAVEIIAKARTTYTGDVTQKKEAITDFVAAVADGRVVLNPSNFQKIKKFIQDMLQKLGIGQPNVSFMKVDNEQDLIKLANFITERFQTGETITFENLEDIVGDETVDPINVSNIAVVEPAQFQFIPKGSKLFKRIDIKWSPKGIGFRVPEKKSSLYDVVLQSGGAVVVINSDATGIGMKKGVLRQGGIGYTFIEQNLQDNIGFAASMDSKQTAFFKAVQEAASIRDERFPEMKGKPVAIFVMVQAPEVMFGNAYGADYFIKAVAKALSNNEITNEDAKADIIEYFDSIKESNKTGRKYANSIDNLINLIQNSNLKSPKDRKKIYDLLISNREDSEDKSPKFGFDARRVLFAQFFNRIAKAKNKPGGRIRDILDNDGFNHKDFYSIYGDENIIKSLEGDKESDRLSDGGFAMTGFFVDPTMSEDDFVSQSRAGKFKHKQFNGRFYGVNPFVLDGKYYVNEAFPEARFVDEDGKPVPVTSSAAGSMYPRTKGAPEAIVERARESAGEPAFQRVAPNGKPSKLNAKQYEQVRTPEFKNWFGDWENDPANASKVVDENGEPRVVFHGTNNTFDEFKKEKLGSKNWMAESAFMGFFFAGDKSTSEAYTGMNSLDVAGVSFGQYDDIINKYKPELDKAKGDINEVYERVRKEEAEKSSSEMRATLEGQRQKLLDNGLDNDKISKFFESILKERVDNDLVNAAVEKALEEGGYRKRLAEVNKKVYAEVEARWKEKTGANPQIMELFLNIRNPLTVDYSNIEETNLPSDIQEAIGTGKDGVIFNNLKDGAEADDIFVALEPNQIKSATANVGTFSTQDNRIQFQKGDKLTLRHGGETKIVKFDESKIKGGVRGELGYGYYFSEDTKYKDYGKEVTSIDASSLNIVNENNVVPKEFANKITEWQSKIPEGGFGIGMKAIAGEYIDRIKSEIKANPSITFQDLRRNVNNQYSVDREPMWSNMMSGIGIDGLAAMQGDGTGRSTIRQAVLYPNEKLNSLIIDQPQFQKVTPTKETRKPVKVAGIEIISSKKKATIDNLFTSSGPLGPAIRTFKEQMGGELTAEVNIAERTTKEAMKLMEKYKGIITTQDVENFLSGNAIPSSFPLDLATKLTEMRAHVDRLTDRLLDLNVIDDKETRQLYMNNKGKYLLRSYELFKAKGPVTVENVVKKLKNVDQAKVDAALKVLEQQIKKDQPNLTPQELKEKAISQANFYLSDEDMAFGGRPIEGSVNAKSLSKRSEYLEDNPAIRALMGEYTDPMYKYYSSIFKLANIASHRDYLNKLKAEGMGKFFFTEATGEATSKIASWETKSLAPLGNLYTFPELKDALMVAEREKKNLLQFLAGHVRIMKTVYNPATHVKNLLGSMAFAVSNGHWMYLGKALSYMKKSKSKELMELIDILNREGVLNNNIGIGEINQYFKKHDNVDDLLKDINLKFNKETAAYLGQKVNVNLKKIPNGLKKLYALEDDIFKVLGFVNETNLYAKAEYGKEFDALNPNEKAKVIKEAAERVKSFYPTFSRVPKFVKGASKAFLVGNFLSFPVESVRVSYNTINQGVKEARSSNPKIRAIGVNRLAGTLLYNGAMTWLLTYASMAAGQGLSGVLGYIFDDEEEIEKREKAKKFRTAWNKDSQVLVNKFSDGKLVYSDMGSIDSYGYQREVWNTFWDNMSNKKGFNKSMAETIAKTVQPYTELDMTVEAILNIMNGRDEFGNDIGNSEAPYSENLKSYTKYISSKFAPGVINSIFKAYRLTQEGDDEAVINEALSQLVRTYTIDLEKSFTNYVYANPGEKNTGETGFKKRLDNAESIYNSVKNSKSMSDSEKEDYYKMAVDAYKNVLRDVSGYYDAAVAGGVDPNKLNQILLRSKLADQRSLPELISIIQNRYDLPDEIYIRR
jgi:hypothetical protein